MEINHTLLIDLQQIGTRQMMQAKQGDSLTRVAKICLYDGGTEFDVPSGATLQIAYAKADGKGGLYDKMPDNSIACTSSGNIVTAKLHPQMFTVAGLVSCELRLMTSSGEQLSTFSWFITVQASASAGAESEDYFRFATLDGVINDIGDLSKLTTTVKRSLVAAINSVNSRLTNLSKKAVKSVNGVQPGADGDVAVAAGGLQIVRAVHTADDVYTATGDALPSVVPGSNGQHTGKGSQIVFIPGSGNSTATPKLKINGGSAVQIRMRAPRNQRDNSQSPDATLPVPTGMLMAGVPYTMTFCGLYWLIDSFVHCPTFVVEMTKSSDGTITVDKTFAQIKSAYAAGQQIVCACYDESAQWDSRVLLPLEVFYENGIANFGRVVETYQGLRELVTAYIHSRSSGDVYGLSAWEIKDTPDIPNPKASDVGKVPVVSESGNYVLQTFEAAKDGKSAYQYAVEGGYTGTETEFAEKLAAEKFANPNAITFTGAVTGSYDGSKPLTVEIPAALSDLSEDADHRVVTDAEKAKWNAKSNFSGSYNDLTDKPTIPDVPVQSVNGKTGAVVLSAEDVGALPGSTVIPTALPNPNALTFTGAVTGSYDGSAPLRVNIPSAVTDTHINELINTALNAIGVAEEGAY